MSTSWRAAEQAMEETSASAPPIDPERIRAFARWLNSNLREHHSDPSDAEYYRLRKRAAKDHGIWREDVP